MSFTDCVIYVTVMYIILLTGITITGLESPLTVGHQNATISCMANIPVDSIEWRDQSSVLNTSSDMDLTELEYTIPLVRDDLQGDQFTCTAVAGDAMYTETVVIQATGIFVLCLLTLGTHAQRGLQ